MTEGQKLEECVKEVEELSKRLGDTLTLHPKYSLDMIIEALEISKKRLATTSRQKTSSNTCTRADNDNKRSNAAAPCEAGSIPGTTAP